MSVELNLTTSLVVCADQVSCELSEEVVILNLRNGEYYGLNSTGAKIWAALQQPCTVAQIRDDMLAEYPDLQPDVCTQDLLEILSHMVGVGLIETAEAGSSQEERPVEAAG